MEHAWPRCGTLSSSVHRRYVRTGVDLPCTRKRRIRRILTRAIWAAGPRPRSASDRPLVPDRSFGPRSSRFRRPTSSATHGSRALPEGWSGQAAPRGRRRSLAGGRCRRRGLGRQRRYGKQSARQGKGQHLHGHCPPQVRRNAGVAPRFRWTAPIGRARPERKPLRRRA